MRSSGFVTALEFASATWVNSSVVRPAVIGVTPIGLVVAAVVRRWDVSEPGGLLAGAALLAGAMINTLLRVWAWADENDRRVSGVSDRPLDDVVRSKLRERIDALERVQAVSGWAVLTSLGLLASLIVLEIRTASSTSASAGEAAAQIADPAWNSTVVLATAAALGLGWLLVLLFLSIIAETVHVGREAVDAQRAVLGAKSAPSERHG